ncbi:MAG: 2,4-diaminopentanoate dehydrogenase [Synergistetes bacterium]|nr:2,4-diaminopentanoate dehydrogenase [Synergistota bacterium]MCX8128299.1 2,4-diaminopentanoate dehydrogenase [Synergistota bacterium]MDW8192613.1 2,4-diaminopentanoate dehydrogenase [Synergistota bacterium]
MRIALWGFGAMGRGIATALIQSDLIKLVGVIDRDPSLSGRDVGEILGIGPYGIRVSDSPEIIRKVNPDLVIIATSSFVREVLPQVEFAVKACSNVITIAEEMVFPFYTYPDESSYLDDLAKRYGVTILGTGVNPGFVLDTLIIALTGVCLKVERIVARRINDLSPFGKTVMESQGVGKTLSEFEKGLRDGKVVGHIGFHQSIGMISRALGWRITRVEEERRPIVSKVYRETPVVKIEPGLVAGCEHLVKAYMGDKCVIEFYHPQQVYPHLEGIETGDYIEIYGDPDIKLAIRPEIPGGKATVAIAVNMIPIVLRAESGLKCMADLPVPRSMLSCWR